MDSLKVRSKITRPSSPTSTSGRLLASTHGSSATASSSSVRSTLAHGSLATMHGSFGAASSSSVRPTVFRGSLATASSPRVESQILDRFNEFFREQKQALQQIVAAQDKQYNATQEHQLAMLTEIGACAQTLQAGMQVQQSTEKPATVEHLQEQEKRIMDHIHACSQRHEDILSKLISSVELLEQQKTVTSVAPQRAATCFVARANEEGLETCAGRYSDDGKHASTLVEKSGASNGTTQEVSIDASIDLEYKAPAPDSSELKSPLLRAQKSGIIGGTDMDSNTKASINGMLEEVEEDDVVADKDEFWAKLAHHMYYNKFTIGIVILNLIWLGIETDVNNADILCDAPWYVQVIDNSFCMFFFTDIAIRTLAREIHCCHYWFDLLLLVQMVWESWIQVAIYLWRGPGDSSAFGASSTMKLLRVFRLMRVMRALRMQKALTIAPQLMVLVKGIYAAMQSVLAILFLTLICIYFFAVVFTMLAKTQDLGGNFNTVPQSMQFFLVQIISGVDGDFISQMLEAGPAYYILFLMFVFIGTLTLMNMLIGVVCDVMSAVSAEEKEKLDVAAVEKVVANMVRILDVGGNFGGGSGSLGLEEFEKLLDHPEIVKELGALQVDVVAFVDFVRFATPEDGEIGLDDLTTLVLQCRGNQACTVKDIMEIRKFVAMQTKLLKDCEISKLHSNIVNLHATIKETHVPLREIHSTVNRLSHHRT